MNHKVLDILEKNLALHEREAIIVALSGGADSVCLLHLMLSIREQLGMAMMACHLNHHIRGEEADRDENFVRSLCERLGVPLFVKDVDVISKAKELGISLELCGREERYAFFSFLAEEHHAWVATAHTLSDSMETAIFHLARGTGLRGLCGIPLQRGDILRPLLSFTRRQVEEYCRQHSLSYVTDSTNLSDDYTRNYIRHHVIPALYKIHPGFEKNFGKTQRLLQQDEAFLEDAARKAAEDAALEDISPSGGRYFRAAELANLPGALRGRAIRLILQESDASCSGTQLELIEKILKPGGTVELSRHLYCRSQGGKFWIHRFLPPVPDISVLVLPGTYPIGDGKQLRLELINREKLENLKKFHQKVLKNTLDYDRISLTARIRMRKPGDRIRLAGRGITKTLKKLFAEAGIPAESRDRIPLLADDKKVLWVYGFGCDETVRVSEKTRRILWIEIEET